MALSRTLTAFIAYSNSLPSYEVLSVVKAFSTSSSLQKYNFKKSSLTFVIPLVSSATQLNPTINSATLCHYNVSALPLNTSNGLLLF